MSAASSSRATIAGEVVGTFLLVFFGCGSVCAAVLNGAQVGIFQVAIVWGIGIALAIHLTAGMSGAHLNPAVTLGFWIVGRTHGAAVPRYVTGQFLGAFLGSAVLYVLFRDSLAAFELAHGIVRGAPGSEATAMIFAEFFPNPAGKPLADAALTISLSSAFLIEAVGTAVLMLTILGLTDERNNSRPGELTPMLIGLTVTCLISLLSPLTMACFNPARDLAPRVFTMLVGWKGAAFSANGSGWLLVYVVAPCIGAGGASLLYRGLSGAVYGEAVSPESTDPSGRKE